MATETYVALATTTVTGSAAASLIVSSLPSTYRDLIMVIDGVSTPSDSYFEMRFNGDTTTSNYFHVYAQGNGSITASNDANDNDGPFIGTSQSNAILQFMDYSATDKHKTCLMRFSSASSLVGMIAFRWANTSAITSIELYDAGGDDFAVGTTLSVYGIEA